LPHLPRGLLSLSCNFVRFNVEDVQKMPPKMTHLDTRSDIPIELLCFLPRSIYHCGYDMFLVSNESFRIFSERRPEALEIEPFSFASFHSRLHGHQLPVKLDCFKRYISASKHEIRFDLTPQCLQYLPRNLKHLIIDEGSFESNDLCSHLPSSLTCLEVLTETIFTADMLDMVPPTIRTLILRRTYTLSDSIIPILLKPTKNIRNLELGGINLGSTVLEHIPTSCDTIDLETMISILRSTLRPKTELVSLDSGWKEHLLEVDLLKLPSHITSLQIGGENFTPDALRFIPQSIIDLRISKLVNVDGTSIAHLSPNLKRLDLVWCEDLTDEDIRSLPTSLTHLDLRYCGNLTDECVRFLPRELIFLNLSSAPLTDSSSEHLPPLLQALHLDYSLYTSRSVPNWPRTLTSINLDENDNFCDVDFSALPPSLTHVKWHWTSEMATQCSQKCPSLGVPTTAIYQASTSEGN